jgi:cell division cycle 14
VLLASQMGIFCVLYLDMAADVAYRPLTTLKPFAPFRDASCGASTFHLTVLDCLRGMERAKSVGFVDFQLGSRSSFSLHEYEYYEQVRAAIKPVPRHSFSARVAYCLCVGGQQ